MSLLRRPSVLLLLAVLLGGAAAKILPRAVPTVGVRFPVARDAIGDSARAFARREGLPGTRLAIGLEADDSLRTFLDLGFGTDSVRAVVRDGRVALYQWTVRLFTPGEVAETRLRYAPDGRLLAVRHVVPDSLRRPDPGSGDARAIADRAAERWGVGAGAVWRYLTESETTVPGSRRVDRTFTFERADARVAGAPIRLEFTVAGDRPVRVAQHVEIPQEWTRRYAEMRAANDELAGYASAVIPLLAIAAGVALLPLARRGQVRWRGAGAFGLVLALLAIAGNLNQLSLAWITYDTATRPGIFGGQLAVSAIVGGLLVGLYGFLTLAAAEALTRREFPQRLDWFALWRARGTHEVATEVTAGYALAAFGFAYVGAFYLVARAWLGWWVPASVFDDPNLIATPAPWVGALATSLMAGVAEESLFRAIPLALALRWAGAAPGRRWAVPAMVVVSALVFSFAHANYPSWPAYSRGVELFVEAVLWAVLYLRVGLPTTILAHVLYDLGWFASFVWGGDAPAYRLNAVIVLALVIAPLAAVAWAARRGLRPLAADERFAAWRPGGTTAPADAPSPTVAHVTEGDWTRRLALAIPVVTFVASLVVPPPPPSGPAFTAPRARIRAAADSALRQAGGNPADWTVLMRIDSRVDPQDDRFLAARGRVRLRDTLAADWLPRTGWTVRYLRTDGTVAARAERWAVELRPDGRVTGVRHVVPQERSGALPDTAEARALAASALARQGVDVSALVFSGLEVTVPPGGRRRDAVVTWEDPRVPLPEGATARFRVHLAGDQVTEVERAVRLPEAFERADREWSDANALRLSLIALAILGVLVAAAWRLSRRPPHRDDHAFTRHAAWRLTLVATLAALLTRWNAREVTLSGWDPATPWSSELRSWWLGTLLSPLLPVALMGIWAAADAARRRFDLPLVPRDGIGASLRRGLALGAIPTLLGFAMRLRPDAATRTPTSGLDGAWPALEGLLAPVDRVAFGGVVVLLVSLLALPAGRRWARVAIALLAAAGAAWVGDGPHATTSAAGRAAAWGLGVLLVGEGVARWGSRDGATWVIALLASAVYDAVSRLPIAATAADQWAVVLQGAMGVVLLLAARRALPRAWGVSAGAASVGAAKPLVGLEREPGDLRAEP